MLIECSDWFCTNLDCNRGRAQKTIYYGSLTRREREGAKKSATIRQFGQSLRPRFNEYNQSPFRSPGGD